VNLIIKSKEDSEENREVIKIYLKSYFSEEDSELTVPELLEKHNEDIKEIDKNKDWWVFSEVSKKFDYEIFIAHAKNLGYHRTKNREFKRENELFSFDDEFYVSYNLKNPETILDFIRTKKKINEPDRFYINFSDIANSISLRLDHRFYRYKIFEEPLILSNYKKKPILLREVILDIRNGKDVQRESYSVDANGSTIETDYKYITVNNIKEEGFVIDEVINLMVKTGEKLSKFKLEKNEIIITRSGTVGISKVFDIDEEETIFIPSGYLIIVKVDESKINPEFLEFFLNSKIMKKYFDVFGTGKTQKNISQRDIKRIPIPSLNLEEQNEITSFYRKKKEKIFKLISEKTQEIKKLNEELGEVIPSKVLKKKLEIKFEEE